MRFAWLLALIALAACAKAGGANNAAPAHVDAVPTNAPANAIAAADNTAKSPKLAQIFTPDILGANVAYLETIAGPAFSTLGADHIYKVDGCEVIVGDAKGRIANIGIKGMSPHCSFPIAQYFASGYDHPVPNYPTFGDISQGFGGGFDSDCLTMCGNAADPVVTLSYQGSHADNFTNLYAAVSIGDGPEFGPYEDWAGKLGAKYGRDYLIDGKYHTGDSMNDVAAKDFANIHPSVIRVGQSLPGGN